MQRLKISSGFTATQIAARQLGDPNPHFWFFVLDLISVCAKVWVRGSRRLTGPFRALPPFIAQWKPGLENFGWFIRPNFTRTS